MKQTQSLNLHKNIRQAGFIYSFYSGVARVKGLPNVFLHEVLLDGKGREVALVVGFDSNFVDVLLFDENYDLKKPLFRSGEIFSVTLSDLVLGRVFDGLGKPRDNYPEVSGEKYPVFRSSPSIIAREELREPLVTGIKVIDATLSIGRGQRELIIGDRKLGKSTLALDIVLNQRMAKKRVKCIYVICGQKEKEVEQTVRILKEQRAFDQTVLVAATARDSYAEQYLSPYVGTAIGEYFRDKGEDALIIYDDLSKHAKVYRDISLLLERVPGREAYPGDVFSLHAQLLERAGQMGKDKGGGSLTALPIVETVEGDLASFIPTNIISITDGQIYLEQGLFQRGYLPAVNVGLSVSRIGSKVQPVPLKDVSHGLRIILSHQRELQKLAQLETVVSSDTIKKIDRGQLLLELLKQNKHEFISWEEQTVLFYSIQTGLLDNLDLNNWQELEGLLLEFIRHKYPDLLVAVTKGKFDDKHKKNLEDIINSFLERYNIKKQS